MNNKMQYPPYSALMSVYQNDSPEYLRVSLKSMIGQSVPPSQFVLVCDGPLTTELDDVIAQYSSKSNIEFKIIRLKCNGGLGRALKRGIEECDCEIIARMDADDIALPFRCEKQLDMMVNCDCDIVSGTVLEFLNSPNEIIDSKVLPTEHEKILEYSKRRNPFNHPAVMYKKRAVLDAGNYQDFYLLEDYYLWIRMLSKGALTKNLEEPLMLMRAGSGMYARRGGLRYIGSQWHLFSYMKSIGYIGGVQWFASIASRTFSGILPNCIRAFLYRKLLRRRAKCVASLPKEGDLI